MLALHYLILTFKTWAVLITLFKLDLPKHFFKLNIFVIILLVGIDAWRFSNYGYHPVLALDVVLGLSLMLIVSLVLTKNSKLLFVLINLLVFNDLVGSVASGLLLTFFQIDLLARTENVFYSLIGAITSLMVISLICMLFKKNNLFFEIEAIKFKPSILIFFMLFSYGFYITLFIRQGNVLSENLTGQIINLVAAVAGFGSILIMFSYILNRNKVATLEAERLLEEKINSLKDRHFQAIEKKDKETRAFRHDIRNHLITLESLAEQKDLQKTKEYTRGIIGELEKIQKLSVISTGSRIIDSNIEYLLSAYFAENIDVEINGFLPAQFKMTDYDITILFSNIFSNAFEATAKAAADRYVKMTIRETNNNLYIAVSNSFDNSENKTLQLNTTKSNKNNHGFGIGKIQGVVKKYGGSVELFIKNNEFITEILLPHFQNK